MKYFPKIDYSELEKFTADELRSMILDDRDKISIHYIAKINRQNGYHSLRKAYEFYYKSQLWIDCINPLLIKWGFKKGLYQVIINHFGMEEFLCRNCGKKWISWKQLVPHHKQYPRLAWKYRGKGFDNREALNSPEKIHFMCIECHPVLENYLKSNGIRPQDVKYEYNF